MPSLSLSLSLVLLFPLLPLPFPGPGFGATVGGTGATGLISTGLFGADTGLHRESLTAILEQLDAQRFTRIHRSYIVNRDRITSVRRLATGSYQLTTDVGNKLPVGRSYRRVVRDMIANDRIPSD